MHPYPGPPPAVRRTRRRTLHYDAEMVIRLLMCTVMHCKCLVTKEKTSDQGWSVFTKCSYFKNLRTHVQKFWLDLSSISTRVVEPGWYLGRPGTQKVDPLQLYCHCCCCLLFLERWLACQRSHVTRQTKTAKSRWDASPTTKFDRKGYLPLKIELQRLGNLLKQGSPRNKTIDIYSKRDDANRILR